jgi:hypothetical protein
MRALTVAVLMLGLGCTKAEAPGATAAAAPKGKGEAAASKRAAEAGPKVRADAFEVSLASSGTYAAGAKGEVLVSLSARPGFHVNADYPVRFTPAEGSAVTFAAPSMNLKESLTYVPCAEHPEESCSASTALSFTAGAAGPATVAGTLAFSVCNPEQCLIEKQPLALAVTVN